MKILKLLNNSSYNYGKVLQNEIEFVPILTPRIHNQPKFEFTHF